MRQSRLEEAEAVLRQAVALRPDFALPHSNILFCLNYRQDLSADAIFAEYRNWDARHAKPLAPASAEFDWIGRRVGGCGSVCFSGFSHACRGVFREGCWPRTITSRSKFFVMRKSRLPTRPQIAFVRSPTTGAIGRDDRRGGCRDSFAAIGSTCWSISPGTPRATACWYRATAGARAGGISAWSRLQLRAFGDRCVSCG